MADSKVTQLTELGSLNDNDLLYVVDVGDTSGGDNGTSKKVSKVNALKNIPLSAISDVTATATEVNILAGATVSTTELNYVTGVTSSIQTQLNSKQATIALTASRAVVSDGSGALAAATTTSTEIGYVNGVTSAIQTQIDGKAATVHTHNASAITAGTIDTARLGSGTANSGTYLRGDQTWQVVTSGDSRRTIDLDWSNAVLPDSDFASIGKTIGSTWVYKTLDFDQTTTESVFWSFRVPSDLSTITSAIAGIDWTAASGSGTFTAIIITRSPSNDEVIDAGTTPSSASATATDTLTATGDLCQFNVTLDTTGWVAGDLIQMEFARDTNDTLSADAKVLKVTVELR